MPLLANCDGFPQSDGGKIESVAVIQGPTSYTTGGFDLQAVQLGMSAFDFVSATTGAGATHNAIIRFTGNTTKAPMATVKIICILLSSGLEVANGTNLSTMYFRVRAIGL